MWHLLADVVGHTRSLGPEHATSKARRVDATAALQERAEGATTFIARRIHPTSKAKCYDGPTDRPSLDWFESAIAPGPSPERADGDGDGPIKVGCTANSSVMRRQHKQAKNQCLCPTEQHLRKILNVCA